MPFCTSCGAEVAADTKFCEQCGAPMEPVTAPAPPVSPVAPATSAAPGVPVSPPPPYGIPPGQTKKPRTAMIIGGIVVVLVIVAAAYFVGLPILKANQKSSNGFVPSPTSSATYTMMQTAQPTPEYTIAMPETTTLPGMVRDDRLEEDYEQIYTLNQKFSFGQKVNFAHVLTRPPLYIRFNLIPTTIIRHRWVSIGTTLEREIITTETSPNAWFEVKIIDAGSGAVIDQQGFGKEYSDAIKQSFMVRQNGNYWIEMSGNEVNADVQMLIGTP